MIQITNPSGGVPPTTAQIVTAIMAALESVTTVTGNVRDLALALNPAFPTATQLIASTSKICPAGQGLFSGSIINGDVTEDLCIIQIMVGAAGSETVLDQASTIAPVAGAGYFTIITTSLIPAGTRISVRGNSTGTAGLDKLYLGYNLGQVS